MRVGPGFVSRRCGAGVRPVGLVRRLLYADTSGLRRNVCYGRTVEPQSLRLEARAEIVPQSPDDPHENLGFEQCPADALIM